MLSVKFLLKEPNKDKSLIYLYVYFGQKKPLKYSTSKIIPVKFWNKEEQRVREVRDFLRAKSINNALDKYERFIESTFDGANILTADYLRNELDIFTGKKEKSGDGTFLTYYKEYTDIHEAKANIKSYVSTYNSLVKLMPANVKIGDVDYTYLETFSRLFSARPLKRQKGAGASYPSLNYTSLQIKNIKAVLHYFEKLGITINQTIANFSKAQELSDSVYLDSGEIEKLWSVELPDRLSKARHIFLIGYYTAMRISDYKTIGEDNIRDNLIFKTTQKTGERVVLPLHPRAKEILLQYGLRLPRISDQRLNDYIKEACLAAGINSTVIITRTEGGKKVSRKYEKWQLITSHTARRSGATNMYLAGIPTISIMMVTGHKTEKAFMKYIKVTREQNAVALANHKFFN